MCFCGEKNVSVPFYSLNFAPDAFRLTWGWQMGCLFRRLIACGRGQWRAKVSLVRKKLNVGGLSRIHPAAEPFHALTVLPWENTIPPFKTLLVFIQVFHFILRHCFVISFHSFRLASITSYG